MNFNKLLYAPNIHQGGGSVLLLHLLDKLKNIEDILFGLDQRLELPEGMQLAGRVHRVKPTLTSRLCFEWGLQDVLPVDVRVLCMGNLPPLFAHQGEQIVFLQNRYLIEAISLGGFPGPIRLRIEFERWWLRSRARHVSAFVVQTEVMRGLLRRTLKRDALVLPFAAIHDGGEEPHPCDLTKIYDFLYVATGEPHKNHKKLIEAWVKLARKGNFPSLCLTIDRERFPKLHNWISGEAETHGLKVTIAGEHAHDGIRELYRLSRALIYPSLKESLGLPLIEACSRGLPILAGNADYVSDVIQLRESFDPESAESIATAVSEFSFQPSRLKINLLSADAWLNRTLCRNQDP